MKTIKITPKIKSLIKSAIGIAVEYEKASGRKLGITGEIAEVMTSQKLRLQLLANSIYPGCDAIDFRKKKTYQIKSARKNGNLHSGRMGIISKHPYDYLILVLMGFNYKIKEMYKLPYHEAEKLAKKYKKRNPPISSMTLNKWKIN